jgi:GPH family glycoside/pentoside/hexuronide:cation symporter
VFFAGSFFVQKCTSGLGIFVAGVILAVAAFPEKATPGLVPVATIDRLTIVFIAIYATLATAAALLFLRFPFGRAEHEARVAGAGNPA